MGPGAAMGPGARWGADYTSGWSMMSPQEREEHQSRMRGMTNYEQCKSYMEQHHQQMTQRAQEKGQAAPMQPRQDACEGLKR